jgi:hypothetical protein
MKDLQTVARHIKAYHEKKGTKIKHTNAVKQASALLMSNDKNVAKAKSAFDKKH